ncbi:hypothetical protein [Undibacterium sp.]|uniref:hypothetical protein n=1 Tax=Undibacterium sp. TaxID=1914977 RepID=UPI00375226A4
MVNVYPINGDGSSISDAYIHSLSLDEFESVEKFMLSAAEQYGKKQSASIQIRLQNKLNHKPPAPPTDANVLELMWWSLQFRWWAYRHAKVQGPGTQVRLFVQYFDPQKIQVHRSTALQEGLIGIANVFASADMREKNNVVIAHEFLHTLGATDKYDLNTDFPSFPDGYAEPQKQPLHPQRFAEIMGGRLPLSELDAAIPRHLNRVVIGTKTAQEINFLPKPN